MTKYDPDGGIIWDDEEDYDPDEDENEFDEDGYLTSDDVRMMDCPMCDGKLSFKYDDNSLYICSLCGYIDFEESALYSFNNVVKPLNEEEMKQYRSERRYWKKQRRERGN